jgi:hypothetical protein
MDAVSVYGFSGGFYAFARWLCNEYVCMYEIDK